MSRRKMRSLREVIDDLRAIPAEWKELDDPVSEIMKIRYGDGWGICTTCGQPTGSADLWQDTCPRCAEIARLEREIGRAVLQCRDTEDIIASIEKRLSYESVDASAYREAEERIIQQETALDELIARYRALLAAGADAATK